MSRDILVSIFFFFTNFLPRWKILNPVKENIVQSSKMEGLASVHSKGPTIGPILKNLTKAIDRVAAINLVTCTRLDNGDSFPIGAAFPSSQSRQPAIYLRSKDLGTRNYGACTLCQALATKRGANNHIMDHNRELHAEMQFTLFIRNSFRNQIDSSISHSHQK